MKDFQWKWIIPSIILLFGRRVFCEWKKLPELLPSQDGSLQAVALGLPEVGHVIAFGHFTSDRRLDCVILDESRSQVAIYLMKPSEGRYQRSLAVAAVPTTSKIVNAVMGDFDHDGYADLLLMHQPRNPSTGRGDEKFAKERTELTLFLGNGETLKPSGWEIDPAIGQVFPLDFDGTLQMALFGSSVKSNDLSPSVWLSKASSPNELSEGFESPQKVPLLGRLALTSWHAQADFDGDGHTDLLLMHSDITSNDPRGFEIWRRSEPRIVKGVAADQLSSSIIENGKSKDATQRSTTDNTKISLPYELAIRRNLPSGTGPLTIADVDGDGHLDIVFAVCNPPDSCEKENSLHIMYNIQRRFCSTHRHYEDCRDPDTLFNSGEAFDFEVEPNTASHVVLNLSQLFPGENVRVLFNDPIQRVPVSISVSDYDLDSYPDLALVVTDRKHSNQLEYSKVALLHNVPCTAPSCTPDQIDAERRVFEEVTEQVEALRNARQISSVAFADWYDLGPPGFLINTYDGTGASAQPRHIAIRNGISRDAFFLRAETLGGVCPAKCRHMSTGSRAERPTTVNFIGPSYRFAFVDPEGALQVRSGTQLGQTSNRALQSPTLLFGLGRTSNFVQNMEVAINSRTGTTHYRTAFNIFPNSELVFVPPHADQNNWRAELQINPGEYIIYVFISVASALIVLAMITGAFKWQERREDETERRKATHLVNFDAL